MIMGAAPAQLPVASNAPIQSEERAGVPLMVAWPNNTPEALVGVHVHSEGCAKASFESIELPMKTATPSIKPSLCFHEYFML